MHISVDESMSDPRISNFLTLMKRLQNVKKGEVTPFTCARKPDLILIGIICLDYDI